MAQRIFVKVMGFSDVERHALNSVFRLSEQRQTIYSPWMPDAPEAPRLALIDGQSYEAQLELESPRNAGLEIIWVGPVAPANAFRAFDRPISWIEVLGAMDELYAPKDALDFDLGFEDGSAESIDENPPHQRRVLIASANRDERLYLRARLALADLTQADDAETGAQALELARTNAYTVALVDFGLPDVNGWAFLKELTASHPAIQHVIMTKSDASIGEHIRARFSGVDGFFNKPVHPGRLQSLLQKVL
ncbi:MAG: response regulator [Pseudomonadota bacterium]